MQISIIITTCRGTEKLLRAVKSAISQTLDETEVIVVDDNGKDTPLQLQTRKILESLIQEGRVRYIAHERHLNGSAARNTGARAARGEYLAFLDDDDVFFPDRVKTLYEEARRSGAELLYGDVLFVRNNKIIHELHAKPDGFTWQDTLVDHLLLGTGSNLFVSRRLYDEIHGFDESFARYQDIEFLVRALQITAIRGVHGARVAKDVSIQRFYPDYDTFIGVQQLYFDTFRREIASLEPDQRRRLLLDNRRELFYSSSLHRDRRGQRKAWALLRQDVPSLTLKERLKISIKGLYLYYLRRAITPLRHRLQDCFCPDFEDVFPKEILI